MEEGQASPVLKCLQELVYKLGEQRTAIRHGPDPSIHPSIECGCCFIHFPQPGHPSPSTRDAALCNLQQKLSDGLVTVADLEQTIGLGPLVLHWINDRQLEAAAALPLALDLLNRIAKVRGSRVGQTEGGME